MEQEIQLHAVIFKSGDWWIGQCLEHDIGAQAKTVRQITRELERAVVAHIVVAEENHIEPFKSIGPAPSRYWKMFEDGLKLETPTPQEFVVQGRRKRAPAQELHLSDMVPDPA